MDTGTVVGLFAGAAVVLGLGIFALVLSIKGFFSSTEPDIRAGGAKIGRPGLVVFLVLGIVFTIAGVGLLVGAIRAVT